jgi:hypothetical protein
VARARRCSHNPRGGSDELGLYKELTDHLGEAEMRNCARMCAAATDGYAIGTRASHARFTQDQVSIGGRFKRAAERSSVVAARLPSTPISTSDQLVGASSVQGPRPIDTGPRWWECRCRIGRIAGVVVRPAGIAALRGPSHTIGALSLPMTSYSYPSKSPVSITPGTCLSAACRPVGISSN